MQLENRHMPGEEGSVWPTVIELVEYAVSAEHPADGYLYERLLRAHAACPEEGHDIFLELTRNPINRVREFAVIVGPQFGGSAMIEALPRLLDDPAPSVQEQAMQSLREVAPERLRDEVPTLRRKFLEWRGLDDNYPIVQLAWTAVELDLRELAPEIRGMAADDALDLDMRRQAAVRAAYLESGPAEILRRIQEHDHGHMLYLCRLAWMKNLEGARAAYERCATTASDEDCRERCQRFALKAAEADAEGGPLSAWPLPE
jgi:hypothetical protein